jgi:hypothetical protein
MRQILIMCLPELINIKILKLKKIKLEKLKYKIFFLAVEYLFIIFNFNKIIILIIYPINNRIS